MNSNYFQYTLAGMLLGLSSIATADVEVQMTLPAQALDPMTSFEVPVYLSDGDTDLASYALQVNYDPAVLHIIEIEGGVFPGFSNTPVANSASFTSGQTDFTANNQGFITTPDMYEAARIRFEVVGEPGTQSTVSLALSPGGGLVDNTEFVLQPAILPAAGVVAVTGDPVAQPPAPPTELTAEKRGRHVGLAWMASTSASAYTVYRRLEDESAFSALAETAELTYKDKLSGKYKSAIYYVVAMNAQGSSTPSETVSIEGKVKRVK